MPAKSKQQQKFMGMVHALNKGDIKPSDVSKSVKDVAKTIKKSDAEDFASTKHSGLPKKVKEQILNALKEYANKMSGNKLGGSGSYGYAPQKGLRDDDGYEDNEGPKDESVFEGMFSTLDQIRQDSKNVRDFVKNVFADRDFKKMKNDKEFIKYLKSIYEGVDESKGVPQNYMQGRTSDYHTALRGKKRDYSGGTNFKKTNHGQPDLENAEEDEEVGLTNKQTKIDPPPPLKENYMMNSDVEDEMKRHRIKKIPIDSHGDKLLKGLKKEKFINKIDNKLKLTYFYASLPKGKRYAYASAKKPLSPLFDRFMNDLMGENIKLTSKMAAYRVAQTIIDMYNNSEEIDSPYYMLKNYFNSFGMDTNRSRTFNGAQFQLDQWLKRNKKYEKAMMKEAKLDHYRISGNSIELLVRHKREKLAIRFKDKRILDKMGFDWSKPKNIEKLLSLKKFPKGMSVSRSFHESLNEVKVETERYFGKKGIIIMIRDGNKLISAIFKDKKNADKFNRNNPSDVKKLYQLAKKTKFPKTIDEYGQRLDLSFIDDKEARLKGTPEPKDAINRDIDENVKVGQMIKYDDRFLGKGTAKVKHIIQAKPNKAGVTHHYITNKGTFSNQSLIGSDDYKKRYNEYSGGSYEYTKGDQYGQNSVNEVGVFPVQNYFKGILPSKSLDIVDDRDRERVKSLVKDLVFTLNDFWKSHKIPFRVREPRKSDLNKFKQKNKRY